MTTPPTSPATFFFFPIGVLIARTIFRWLTLAPSLSHGYGNWLTRFKENNYYSYKALKAVFTVLRIPAGIGLAYFTFWIFNQGPISHLGLSDFWTRSLSFFIFGIFSYVLFKGFDLFEHQPQAGKKHSPAA